MVRNATASRLGIAVLAIFQFSENFPVKARCLKLCPMFCRKLTSHGTYIDPSEGEWVFFIGK